MLVSDLQVLHQDNQLVTESRQVARMVGKRHSDLLESIKIYCDILLNGNFRRADFFIEHSYQDSTGRTLPCYLLTRKGCDMVANKMTGEKGVLFTAAYVTQFEEMEKHLNFNKPAGNNLVSFEKQLLGAKYASEILRVDETSKIRMLEAVHNTHGVPTTHLPAYVDEEVTQSITELLKVHGSTVSAVKANTRLVELGILENKERPSSKGTVKKFKSLTATGERFGKNILSPNNPKETQPHYYASKFAELLKLIEGGQVCWGN